MTSRDRVLKALNHQIPDRVPVQDSPWGATVSRWHKEGLPENISPEEYFGYEFAFFGADLSPRFPVKTLEKNDEYIITTTSTGEKIKNHRDYSTTPEVIDCYVKTKDDWNEVKKRLKPDWTRVDWATGLANNKTAIEEGKFVCFAAACGYDALQGYMKSEQLLITIAEDPDWVKDMVMTLAELIIVTAELMINNGFKFDGAFLYNDMGYRNGLLFSPDSYRKTHYEADRLLYGYFHSKGMKTLLHSCGNVTELIPVLIEVGLDCLQPLEVKAGMDVITLKEKYGDRLAFMGNIDVRLMADEDPAKIENEIKRKFEVAKRNGGYIYHSDHSVPKNVSFQQYCRVMELVKQYGVYPEYKEEETMPAPPEKIEVSPEIKPAEKRGPKLFGKKPKAPSTQKPAEPEKPAQAEQAPKKKGIKIFGRKKG
ncbi:MAG TPA: uroporphyrinogen decarboxylase family protein [bacterium]|nr:uroporphyrinogen decarboxylase family protein [bacterium]HPP30262.1 uroporphyrinogen decarboxylase family protein [bacterium]